MSAAPIAFDLDDDALADLILQRTAPFIALGGTEPLIQWKRTGAKVQLTTFLKTSGQTLAFIQRVVHEITGEFNRLVPQLQQCNLSAAASIGPGQGIFELLLYRFSPTRLTLIDIETSSVHGHGFAQNGSGYASLLKCKDFLTANGVLSHDITLCNPNNQPLPQQSFDAVFSMLSMGFHYPCDEYAAFLASQIRPGGLLIFDRRLNVVDPGWELLQTEFETVEFFETKSSVRLILRKR